MSAEETAMSLSERASDTIKASTRIYREERSIKSGMAFKVAKRVTHAQIKLRPGTDYAFRIDSALYRGKEEKPQVKTDGEPLAPRQPPWLVQVTMIDSGEEGVIVMPTIAVTELNDNYPEESYVGKFFNLRVLGKKQGRGGNNYNEIELLELEPDEDVPVELNEDVPDKEDTKPKGKAKK